MPRHRGCKGSVGPMEQWLQSAGIAPSESCGGVPAIKALKRKIHRDFGVAYVYTQYGNLYSLFDQRLLVHRDDARTYLWGKQVSLELQDGDEDQSPDSSTAA